MYLPDRFHAFDLAQFRSSSLGHQMVGDGFADESIPAVNLPMTAVTEKGWCAP